MAEHERTRIRDRQKEGIHNALNKGIKFGRKKIQIDDKFKLADKYWKENTFYRCVKEYELSLK